jgi:hypothetical protein
MDLACARGTAAVAWHAVERAGDARRARRGHRCRSDRSPRGGGRSAPWRRRGHRDRSARCPARGRAPTRRAHARRA